MKKLYYLECGIMNKYGDGDINQIFAGALDECIEYANRLMARRDFYCGYSCKDAYVDLAINFPEFDEDGEYIIEDDYIWRHRFEIKNGRIEEKEVEASC